MATITVDGFDRVGEAEIAERFGCAGRAAVGPRGHGAAPRARDHVRRRGTPAMSMPFYVAPEQVMKDRADYARKGIARGRSLAGRRLRPGHPDLRREPVVHAAQDQRDLRPHRLRRGRQVQRVRPAAHRRRARRRPQGLRLQPRGRRRPQPGQPVRLDPGPDLHPRDEADGGRDPRGRGRAPTRADDQLFHILYDGTVMDEDDFTVLGGEAEAINTRLEESWTDDARPGRARCGRRGRPGRARPHPGRRASSRRPCSSAPTPAAPSAASSSTSAPPCSPERRSAQPMASRRTARKASTSARPVTPSTRGGAGARRPAWPTSRRRPIVVGDVRLRRAVRSPARRRRPRWRARRRARSASSAGTRISMPPTG